MTLEEHEDWERVQYRMKEEGIDYCFQHYSSWTEVKDEKFHTLRKQYLDNISELQKYVDIKVIEGQDLV